MTYFISAQTNVIIMVQQDIQVMMNNWVHRVCLLSTLSTTNCNANNLLFITLLPNNQSNLLTYTLYIPLHNMNTPVKLLAHHSNPPLRRNLCLI